MNYYELLGIEETATEEEIKKAYKSQIKKWHPDINKDKDSMNMSIKLNEAKEILLDNNKRKEYDESLNKKIEDTYNMYTQNTKTKEEKDYEDEKNYVTKWQYLKDWLKYSKESNIRKIIGLILVILETLLYLVIKISLITLAFLCKLGKYIILFMITIFYPIIVIIFLLFIFLGIIEGFKLTLNNPLFILILIILGMFILSITLNYLGNIFLSFKLFNILYNKMDIKLFKLAVGYKEK